MNTEALVERLFQSLVVGNRADARDVARQAIEHGCTCEQLANDVYWPTHQMLEKLHRSDQLSTLAHHYGTRLLRSLVDQAQAGYIQNPSIDRSLLIFCGASESDELAAQLVADMAEARGFTVRFGGGGIANDELLGELNDRKPDVVMMFSSTPDDAPRIRELIDKVREIGACTNVQFAVGGGVFARAEGLAQEIGADLWADTPQEMLSALVEEPERRATPAQRTVGRQKKREVRAAA